ncbi:MAG: hypothetical protein PHT07_09970 [Paludibacter sp.]|nr:hypothetical protein [Paludibacter sp.]
MESIVGDDGFLKRDTNPLGEKFLEISDMLYHYNNSTPVAANMSYIGSPEEEGTRFSTATLRDFVENTEATKMRLNILLGGLFIKSRDMNEAEKASFIRKLQNTPDENKAYEIINEHMYGLNDTEKHTLFVSLSKIKKLAEDLGKSFEKSAADQNPFYRKIIELRAFAQHEEVAQAELAKLHFDYEEKNNPSYEMNAFKEDISLWNSTGEVPQRFQHMVDAGVVIPPKEFWEQQSMSLAEKEQFMAKYVSPILPDPTKPNYEKMTKIHNQAAHVAREIVTKSFFGKTSDDFSVGDCIPLFSEGENVARYARNLRGVISNAARRVKENDLQIAQRFGSDDTFELWLADEVAKKIVLEPSEDFKRAIRNIDSARVDAGDLKRTPNAKTEEVLLKAVEDAVYNAVMIKTGGGEIASNLGVVAHSQQDIINIDENLKSGKYDPSRYTNRERNDLRQARDLYLIQETFKRVQNGQYSREDAQKAIGMMETNVLSQTEKESLGKAIGTFYDHKTSSFDSSHYNISKEDLQYTMDVNSSIIERQAREIYQQFYGDRPFDNILAAMGLARSKGQDFFGCISSGRNATIRTHSPGHAIKGCIDKLVQDYEKAASESTRGLDNPIVAVSGIAGFLVVFNIFQEAAAQRLKQTALRYELEAAEKINFAASAKTPIEKVARDGVIRNAQEKVTEEIVPAEEMDAYMSEMLWADHEYQKTLNPYLAKNVNFKKIASNSGKAQDGETKYSAKSIAAYDAIKDILDKSGLEEDIEKFMEEAKRQEQNVYEEARLNLKEKITSLSGATTNSEIAEVIRLQERYISLLKDGIISGADPRTNNPDINLEYLFDEHVQYGREQIQSIKSQLESIYSEITTLEQIHPRDELKDRRLLECKITSTGIEGNLEKLKKLLISAEDAKNEIGKVRQIAWENAFSNAYNIFQSAEKLAQRYGGMNSSQLFLSRDINRLDSIVEYLKGVKENGYKAESLRNAVSGIKATLRSLTLEQISEATKEGTKASFMRYRNNKPSEVLASSDIKFHAIKQRNGSYQVIMMEKGVIPDLKTMKNADGKSLISSFELGTKTRNEFEIYLKSTGKDGNFKDILLGMIETGLIPDMKDQDGESLINNIKDGKITHNEYEKYLNIAYDMAKGDVADFARRCGISDIGETRYSTPSSRKDLSNVHSAGLARKDQGGFFDGIIRAKEPLIPRQR